MQLRELIFKEGVKIEGGTISNRNGGFNVIGLHHSSLSALNSIQLLPNLTLGHYRNWSHSKIHSD